MTVRYESSHHENMLPDQIDTMVAMTGGNEVRGKRSAHVSQSLINYM